MAAVSTTTPRSGAELMARASALAGRRLGELAEELGFRLPRDLRGHKGVVGELMERALGAIAASRPVPDFEHLGIELKTVPLGRNGLPRESTHVCTVAADDLVGQRWENSTVRRKLARVLPSHIASSKARSGQAERSAGRPTR